MTARVVAVCAFFIVILHTALSINLDTRDVCVCDCCFETSLADGTNVTDCVHKDETTFKSPKCSKCSVKTCAERYKDWCGAKDAIVGAKCIVRKAWYLEFIQVAFIISAVIITLVGLFIKTYDGYHPIENPNQNGKWLGRCLILAVFTIPAVAIAAYEGYLKYKSGKETIVQ